jgi:hypothetical protein
VPVLESSIEIAASRARVWECYAATALALLDDGVIDTAAYPYAHLVRGVLLADLARVDEASAELAHAERVARSVTKRRRSARGSFVWGIATALTRAGPSVEDVTLPESATTARVITAGHVSRRALGFIRPFLRSNGGARRPTTCRA